jgi:hypothetical protein
MIASAPISTQLETISQDPEFLAVIREGSWEASHNFIAGRVEEIKSILRQRLQVSLGCESTLFPESSVYADISFGGKKEELFLQGKAALRSEDYARAANCFEASAHKVTGINRDIANNYRAYSLARLGELLRARLILSPLCQQQFLFPSAYWNLACCMSSDLEAERLAVLADGLCHVPHPLLLYGAVHFATLLGHKLLPNWLLCLPLTEAQLLYYYLKYDQLSSVEKETCVLRLGAYVFCGEPEFPDPLDYGVPQKKLKNFVHAMYERQKHAEVVDFFLRCGRGIGRRRYNYWEIKADYLNKFGKKRRAVNAFRSELYCRLDLLARTRQLQSNLQFLSATRMRVGYYLRQCLGSDLQRQGSAIWNMLARFEEAYRIRLLPFKPQLEALFCANEIMQPAEAENPINGTARVKGFANSYP